MHGEAEARMVQYAKCRAYAEGIQAPGVELFERGERGAVFAGYARSVFASFDGNAHAALDLVIHDKKCKGGKVSAIYVDHIGSFEISDVEIEEFKAAVKENLA